MASRPDWQALFLREANRPPEFWRKRMKWYWPLVTVGLVVLVAWEIFRIFAFDSDSAPTGIVLFVILAVAGYRSLGLRLGASEYMHGRAK